MIRRNKKRPPSSHPKVRYNDHMQAALRRDIPFLLSFEQWWSVWEPYWHLRGRKAGQCVMARHGDKGPYALGNVSIIEATANRRERRGTVGPRCSITGRYLPAEAA